MGWIIYGTFHLLGFLGGAALGKPEDWKDWALLVVWPATLVFIVVAMFFDIGWD